MIMSITEALNSLSCTSSVCMAWIIIAINILTVSYLVFCSFFKFTKTLKVLGFIWLFLALAGIVAVIVYHTCIFTLICAVFTILIIITTFAVILTHSGDDRNKKKKNSYGCYVINPTTDDKYTFSFYDKKNQLVLHSGYVMDTLEEIKSAINVSRQRGEITQFEDHTESTFLDNGFPKIELHANGKLYFYLFRCNSYSIALKSKYYCKYKNCLKDARKMLKIMKSSKVYYSSNIVRVKYCQN